jgi:hypothetical protein
MESQAELNEVIETFFEQWTAKVMAWYEEKQKEYEELGYKAFYDKYHLMSGFPDLSKSSVELIKYAPLHDEPHRGRSIESYVRQEMRERKAKLLHKVGDKVGEITELSLHCGDDGTPNGRVTGTKGSVYISTIIAGGHNIQCLHYRVLVK